MNYLDGFKSNVQYTPFIKQSENTTIETPKINIPEFETYKPQYNISYNNYEKTKKEEEEKTTPVPLRPKDSPIALEGISNTNINNLNVIANRLKENGMGKAQIAASLATVVAESGANPLAVGDKGKAKGLWQWHPDRYKASGDLDSQINLILSELADVKGGGWLGRKDYMDAFNTGDLYTAVDTLTRRYIRPANGVKETQKRYAIAQNIYNQLGKWM